MTLVVFGSGAFGTALAVSLAANGPVTLLGRDAAAMAQIQDARENKPRLPGVPIPDRVKATADTSVLGSADTILFCIPTQSLAATLKTLASSLSGKTLVACCKGIDVTTLVGPANVIADCVPDARPFVLTGPSFAADIALGLPTALTLAGHDDSDTQALQSALTRPSLRLYRSTDVAGAQLGGALKNVIAIAAGACMGASLGESARAALITRGFAEMRQLAHIFGARAETLMGLSGMGDLILTCSSSQSRNYALGLRLGKGKRPLEGVTVEGAATAQAVVKIAEDKGLDLPVSTAVHTLVTGQSDVPSVLSSLLSRPLRSE